MHNSPANIFTRVDLERLNKKNKFKHRNQTLRKFILMERLNRKKVEKVTNYSCINDYDSVLKQGQTVHMLQLFLDIYFFSPLIYIYIYLYKYIYAHLQIYILIYLHVLLFNFLKTFSFRMLCLKKPYNMDFLK